MKRYRNAFTSMAMIAALLLSVAGMADAQKRNDREIRDALRSLNSKIEDFENVIRDQMRSSSANNGSVSVVSDDIRDLRNSVQQFQDKYDRRSENRDDVSHIVNAARTVDGFLKADPQNGLVNNDWSAVLKQIDRLSSNYGFTTDWNNGDAQNVIDYPDKTPPQIVSGGLSGTYQIDTARSEKIDDVITDPNLTNDQREDLKEKLTAPDQIAINIRGQQVTLATSNVSPATFTADGREKVEQSATGKTIRLRATINGDALTISSLGGETDYTVTFTSVVGGQTLKVMRRITTEYTSQTVFLESVYNKTDSVARLGIDTGRGTTDPNGTYSDNDQNGNVANGGAPGGSPPNGRPRNGAPSVTARPGNYVIPNGTVIKGTLENEINTKVSQNNDRFRMKVTSPDEFRGATVEGYISGVNRSGKIVGQSNLTFNFEKITLSDGKTYDFAGNLQGITDTTGKVVKIDNEGTIKGSSQTKQTVTRGGIGAGLGAIIGAIAGGGKGAAIGAIIGGGAGAGSAVITGRNDIQLLQGSTIAVQSSSPIRQTQPPDK